VYEYSVPRYLYANLQHDKFIFISTCYIFTQTLIQCIITKTEFSRRLVCEGFADRTYREQIKVNDYSHVPHNDVSVNDGLHIRRWSHNKDFSIIIKYYNIIIHTIALNFPH